jgi:hypothetical protein
MGCCEIFKNSLGGIMSRVVIGRDELLDEVIQIYYSAENNVFFDEGGYVIDNIHRLISPNMVFLLKYKKDDIFVFGVNGEYIELMYESDNLIYGDSKYAIDRYID